jgi:hypothetical protein
MVSEPPREEPEPLSPELVMVSSPEVAQRAREQLPEQPGFVPAPAPIEAEAEAPPVIERTPPPAYPRLAIEEPPPEPRRRRVRRVFVIALAGAVVAAAGYAAATRWYARDATHPGATPATRPTTASEALTVTAAAPRAAPTTAAAPVFARPSTASTTTAAAHPASPPAHTTAPKPAASKQTTASRAHPAAPKGASAGFVPARSWVWAPATGADGYELTFYFDGRVALRAHPTRPAYTMPATFRYEAGAYRWTVRVLPAGAVPAIVDSTFVLTAAAARQANAR